jgi:ubiquitin carboxyl-terminal hydrolase 4/11/15
MNSAIQCLSNAGPLCDFFLSRRYETEINQTNPLGMGGEMARSFGALMEKLWMPRQESSISPREVKVELVILYLFRYMYSYYCMFAY